MNKNNSAKKDYKQLIFDVLEKSKEKQEIEPEVKNTPIDQVKKTWDMNDKIIELFVKNIDQDQKLRSKYAMILIIILGIELIALITIFCLKGIGILNYSDATFNIFISGGIAEIFILVRVIVKYLFKDNLGEVLKIIIETNNIKKIQKFKNHQNNKKQDKP